MTTLANDVEVANLALSGMLGKPSITSFSGTSTEAIRCNQFYPLARDFVASKSDWTFLRERAALAEATNDQSESWDKAYDWPNRSIKLMYLYEPTRPMTPYKDYVRIGDKLYTNLNPAYAHYITLQTTTEIDWPLHFKTAIAAKLAEYLAPFMTRRGGDVGMFREMAAQELSIAIETDASEEHRTYTEDEIYVYGQKREGSLTEYDGSTFWSS